MISIFIKTGCEPPQTERIMAFAGNVQEQVVKNRNLRIRYKGSVENSVYHFRYLDTRRNLNICIIIRIYPISYAHTHRITHVCARQRPILQLIFLYVLSTYMSLFVSLSLYLSLDFCNFIHSCA